MRWTSTPSDSPLRRGLWFVGIWAASVVVVGLAAEALKRIILG